MDILKFIKSFNTVNSYLIVSFLALITLVVYLFVLNPT
ncbi:MAG: hypothetical protein RR633_03140 [Acinetobacter sp.]